MKKRLYSLFIALLICLGTQLSATSSPTTHGTLHGYTIYKQTLDLLASKSGKKHQLFTQLAQLLAYESSVYQEMDDIAKHTAQLAQKIAKEENDGLHQAMKELSIASQKTQEQQTLYIQHIMQGLLYCCPSSTYTHLTQTFLPAGVRSLQCKNIDLHEALITHIIAKTNVDIDQALLRKLRPTYVLVHHTALNKHLGKRCVRLRPIFRRKLKQQTIPIRSYRIAKPIITCTSEELTRWYTQWKQVYKAKHTIDRQKITAIYKQGQEKRAYLALLIEQLQTKNIYIRKYAQFISTLPKPKDDTAGSPWTQQVYKGYLLADDHVGTTLLLNYYSNNLRVLEQTLINLQVQCQQPQRWYLRVAVCVFSPQGISTLIVMLNYAYLVRQNYLQENKRKQAAHGAKEQAYTQERTYWQALVNTKKQCSKEAQEVTDIAYHQRDAACAQRAREEKSFEKATENFNVKKQAYDQNVNRYKNIQKMASLLYYVPFPYSGAVSFIIMLGSAGLEISEEQTFQKAQETYQEAVISYQKQQQAYNQAHVNYSQRQGHLQQCAGGLRECQQKLDKINAKAPKPFQPIPFQLRKHLLPSNWFETALTLAGRWVFFERFLHSCRFAKSYDHPHYIDDRFWKKVLHAHINAHKALYNQLAALHNIMADTVYAPDIRADLRHIEQKINDLALDHKHYTQPARSQAGKQLFAIVSRPRRRPTSVNLKGAEKLFNKFIELRNISDQQAAAASGLSQAPMMQRRYLARSKQQIIKAKYLFCFYTPEMIRAATMRQLEALRTQLAAHGELPSNSQGLQAIDQEENRRLFYAHMAELALQSTFAYVANEHIPSDYRFATQLGASSILHSLMINQSLNGLWEDLYEGELVMNFFIQLGQNRLISNLPALEELCPHLVNYGPRLRQLAHVMYPITAQSSIHAGLLFAKAFAKKGYHRLRRLFNTNYIAHDVQLPSLDDITKAWGETFVHRIAALAQQGIDSHYYSYDYHFKRYLLHKAGCAAITGLEKASIDYLIHPPSSLVLTSYINNLMAGCIMALIAEVQYRKMEHTLNTLKLLDKQQAQRTQAYGKQCRQLESHYKQQCKKLHEKYTSKSDPDEQAFTQDCAKALTKHSINKQRYAQQYHQDQANVYHQKYNQYQKSHQITLHDKQQNLTMGWFTFLFFLESFLSLDLLADTPLHELQQTIEPYVQASIKQPESLTGSIRRNAQYTHTYLQEQKQHLADRIQKEYKTQQQEATRRQQQRQQAQRDAALRYIILGDTPLEALHKVGYSHQEAKQLQLFKKITHFIENGIEVSSAKHYAKPTFSAAPKRKKYFKPWC